MRLPRRRQSPGSMYRNCRTRFPLLNLRRSKNRRRRPNRTARQRPPHQAMQRPSRVIDPPVAVPNRPAPSADSNATSVHRAREQQRRQQAQARPEPPAPGNCSHRSHFCSADDHVRGARDCRPCPALCRAPPPARGRQLPAAAMGARGRPECADTAHSRTPRPYAGKPPAPMPIRPPDQTERLAHALQQLVDRLQTADRPEPKAVRVRPRGRASM